MRSLLLCLLILLPGAVLSQEFLKQFPCRQPAEYFTFYSKTNSPQIANIERFADGFIKVINRDFFKADFDYPIRVVVLEDRLRFKEFVTNELHLTDSPDFGIYDPNLGLFATYAGSGLGTFAHEILHPLVEKNLKARPPWAVEGIPTFFEKFYGYWKDDALVIKWGFQNPWRVASLGTNLEYLDLKAVIADPKPGSPYSVTGRNESKWRMASMFLWEQGCFKRFLKLIAARDRAGYATYFEAAMEKPIEEIIPLWQAYLSGVSARRTSIMSLPASEIFENEAAFQNFASTNAMVRMTK